MTRKLNLRPARNAGKSASGWIALLAIASSMVPGAARAQAAPPTACPTNYTCSYQSSSTQALIGGATDGQPQSRVGFMTFDSSGNWTGVLSGSLNGKVVVNTAVGGTCTSGTATTLATLTFNAGLSGSPVSLALVTRPDGNKIDLLLAGSTLASDTRVIVAVCYGN